MIAVPAQVPDVTTPLFSTTLDILEAELTYKLPPIPTPPPTIKVPVEVDVDEITEVNPTDPITCNLYAGFERPIPKFPAYSLALIFPFALALNNGIPVMSLKD